MQTKAVELGVMTSIWQHHVVHVEGLLNKVWWSLKDVDKSVKQALVALLKGIEGVVEEMGRVYQGEGYFSGEENEEEDGDDKRTVLHGGTYRHVTLFSYGWFV